MALRAAGQGTRWRQVLSQWQTRRARLVRNRNDWTEQSGTGDSTTLKPSFRKQLQHEGTKGPEGHEAAPRPRSISWCGESSITALAGNHNWQQHDSSLRNAFQRQHEGSRSGLVT